MSAGYPASTFVLPSGPGVAPAPPVAPHLASVTSQPSRNLVCEKANSPPGLVLPDLEPSLMHIGSPVGLTLPMDSWDFSFHGLS